MEDQLFFDELLKACEMMNSNETTAIGAESVDNFFDFETLRLTENQVLQLKDVKPVRSARQAKDKEFVQSSAEYQVLHLQEKKRFRLSPRAQDKQVFPSSVSRSAYVQEFQLVEFPAHAQGIQLVLPPIDVQEKHLVESYAPVEEKQPVQSQVQDIQTPRSPTHVLARVQEITEYLIAHELWQVPDSVLYEEPVETECDLETSVEINDPTDAAGEVAYVGEIDILNGEGDVHLKARKRGGRRHRGQFMKRPMALTEVIEEMQRHDLRENALRCLSGHLVEEESDTEVMWQRREQDPDFYRQAGFFIFHSCSTLIILIQEILVVYERFNAGDLNVRGSKRLCNVLVLLQSVAANDETRLNFVKGACFFLITVLEIVFHEMQNRWITPCVGHLHMTDYNAACLPNYLIPIILSEYTDEVYENLRALSLSVISIVCQAREKEVIKWALQNDIVEVCFHALDIGSELSKVIGMTILDSILRVDEGLSAICEPSSDLLPRFIKLCGDLVSVLAVIRGFSPRLLFLVVRSFILLCQNCRALELLKDKLPPQLEDTTFRDVKMEYPLFNYLRHQLLLCIGKAKDYLPSVDPSPASPASSSSSRSKREDKSSLSSGQATTESVVVYVTPMRPINLNKQDWSARLLL